MLRTLSAAGLSLLLVASTHAATWNLKVTAGKTDVTNTPVKATVTLADAGEKLPSVVLKDEAGKTILGQLTRPSLLSKAADGKQLELNFIVASLPAGKTASYTATTVGSPQELTGFSWQDTQGQYMDLSYGMRPVLRYMYTPLDPANREATFKVFHHVFDPTGKRLVTKGPGGRYTHHRGLFYGFNKVTYDGKSTDIWHCPKASQQHEKVLLSETGPVLGRQRVEIAWYGDAKEVFAREERELTAYAVQGGTLIDFASRLHSTGPKIHLDGDPQHAGFHFRADNEVASKTAKQTYYLRPDGKGAPGATRNWPAQKDHVNLPFDAMSFVLGDQRYTAVYLDRPQNPKEARFSERDYGRFGSYFVYDLAGDETLDLKYRVWLQEGELDLEGVQNLSQEFVDPPQVTVAE